MNFKYMAQDEYDVLDSSLEDDGKKLKEPVEITITIQIEKKRYESVKKRYKTPIHQKIKDLFKPSK